MNGSGRDAKYPKNNVKKWVEQLMQLLEYCSHEANNKFSESTQMIHTYKNGNKALLKWANSDKIHAPRGKM